MLLVVLVLSVVDLPMEVTGLEHSDKAIHALTYMGLMLWFAGIFRPRYRPILFLGLLLFGLLTEGVQSLTTSRSAQFFDFVSDAVGAGISWGLAIAGLSGWCLRVESRWHKGVVR
jgi:VanZ family protein